MGTNRVMQIAFTDTVDNWKETTDACSNIHIGGLEQKDQPTKTYAAWSDAHINTISFYRPTGLPPLTLE